MNKRGRFYVAPFTIDGESLGVHEWDVAQLSAKWLSFAQQLIHENGSVLRRSLGGPLSHLEIKLTAADGIGLGTMFANDQIVVSTAYFGGANPAEERELETMFLESLRGSAPVKRHASMDLPFDQLRTIRERPLHVVVVWGNPQVSDQDHELIREFANHFAGAFLCSPSGPESGAV